MLSSRFEEEDESEDEEEDGPGHGQSLFAELGEVAGTGEQTTPVKVEFNEA